MRALSHASLWHWTQREDGTASHLSIGYWQLSRVYALLGRAADAAHYGERCLECSREESPFFLGYAYEALARAAKVAGDAETLDRHLAEARRLCAQVTAPEDRAMLERDLEELGLQG